MKISKLIKRGFDLTLAFLACIILSPVMIIIAVLIRFTMGQGIVFRQLRPGLHGKPFTIYKFRTMTDCCDEDGHLLPDAERLPPLGKFLRSTSLDELPELLNVLKGDMNLVGPRPLLMQYLNKYTPEQARRHEVKPGITGWAQINGRQNIPFSKRIEYDLWYVDNRSFFIDFKILILTFGQVLTCRGVKSGQDVREVDDLGLSVDISDRKAEQKRRDI